MHDHLKYVNANNENKGDEHRLEFNLQAQA